MDKKRRILAVKKRLDEVYPGAECTLDYENPLQLLIATILAAQCTDLRVNAVTPQLFERYRDVEGFAEADLDELMEEVRPTGFYRNKAKNIIECCRRLRDAFDGVVPDNMDDLLTLKGVGRKTASVILGEVYKKPAIVIDTHAGRLLRRMGFTKNTDPVKVERDLARIIPQELSFEFCHQLVHHGRRYCMARKPNCVECPIEDLCKKAFTLKA